MKQLGNIEDYWPTAAADDQTSATRQYVSNSAAITICQIDLCLGSNAGTLDSTVYVQIYDDSAGSPGTQNGADSSTQAGSGITATLTGSPLVACGGTNAGQVVSFTWSGTKPAPTGNFHIVLRKTAGTDLRAGTYTHNGHGYDGAGDSGTIHVFDVYDGSPGVPATDKVQDAYFQVYTQ